jgi:Ca-activated chloride channel family protein
MHLFVRFAYIYWLYAALFVFCVILLLRHYYSRCTIYNHPLVGYFSEKALYVSQLPAYVLYALRCTILFLLVCLLGKPQIVDQKSKVTVEGIDIMMVLDISGSMISFDDIKDKKTRIAIAKEEAIRFVEKRHDDAIGLVVFGGYAMMKSPLTPDKTMLKGLLQSLQMNPNDSIHDGTVISQAVITAARHLQKSKSASKIIILLTDGEPTAADFPASEAIAIAKAFGIKVYSIGIGNNGITMWEDPYFGIMKRQSNFDTKLLQALAQQTGGMYFDAKKAQDLAKIYDEIDQLEKSVQQSNVFMKYHDFFIPIIFLVLALLFFELCLSSFVWTIL